jgi:hypothetical protein
MTAGMCRTCPFRPRTFIRLAPGDVDALVDFVEGPNRVAICHDTLDSAREIPCVGAVRFLRRLPGVFRSRAAMRRAHGRSRRRVSGELWNVRPELPLKGIK